MMISLIFIAFELVVLSQPQHDGHETKDEEKRLCSSRGATAAPWPPCPIMAALQQLTKATNEGQGQLPNGRFVDGGCEK